MSTLGGSTTIWHDLGKDEGAILIAHIDKSLGNEKAIANANLIASAPEMLRILNSLTMSVMAHPHYVFGKVAEWDDYVSTDQEVINKALGK